MSGPLAGLRVIEVAGIGPGPFAGMLLADLGADVVRVERLVGGMTPVPWEQEILNRGKRSVAVDLKAEAGTETVLRLVEHADILFEAFRPGVAERLGIGPEACWQRNPSLVYGRMTGWGQDGPSARTAGHDITYIAPTGALHTVGAADLPPQIPVNYVGDFGGGSLYLVVGLLAALHEARSSGRGQVVDAAIVDGAASLTAMVHSLLAAQRWRDERGVNVVDGGAPYYGTYATADGRYMAVGAIEPEFFAEFAGLLGVHVGDVDHREPSTWPRMRDQFRDAFAGRTQAEWVSVFDGSDACVAPVLSLTEAPEHPHLRARHTFVEHNGITQPAPAPRFSRTPSAIAGPPCTPGQHTDEVLAQWRSISRQAQPARGAVSAV